MDISKARTTKVTSVERVDSGLHKARQRLVSGPAMLCRGLGGGALVYHYGDEMIHF